MEPYRTETIDTAAGIYTIELHQDVDPALHPLEDDCEVFAALIEYSGYGGRWDKSTDTLDSAGRSGEVLRQLLSEYNEDDAARRYVKWATLTGSPWVLAMTGRSTVNREYYRMALLADSRELPQVNDAIKHVMADYFTYANGEVCGFVVKGPAGDVLESVWGYYSDEQALDEARDTIDVDVETRLERANRVGAGFVGIL